MTKPTGRRRPGRPYREAFPMLDVHEVVRAAAEGRVYVEWVNDEGVKLGFASIQELTADAARFFFRVYDARNIEPGSGQLDVAVRRRKVGKYWAKPSFVCPECPREVARLYWVRGGWACNTCHDILTISQRLDTVNKAIYLREVHERELKSGSSDPKTAKRIAQRKNGYGSAVSLLANHHRSELPWHLQFRTFGRWLEPGEVPRKQDRNDPGYGWVPGMRGQMPGLSSSDDLTEPPAQRRATEEPAPSPRRAARQPTAAPPTPIDPKSRAPGAVDKFEEMFERLDLLKPMEIDLKLIDWSPRSLP